MRSLYAGSVPSSIKSTLLVLLLPRHLPVLHNTYHEIPVRKHTSRHCGPDGSSVARLRSIQHHRQCVGVQLDRIILCKFPSDHPFPTHRLFQSTITAKLTENNWVVACRHIAPRIPISRPSNTPSPTVLSSSGYTAPSQRSVNSPPLPRSPSSAGQILLTRRRCWYPGACNDRRTSPAVRP